MPGTSQEVSGKEGVHHRVYEVLLHHYLPSFAHTFQSATSTLLAPTAAPSAFASEVALTVRFKIRRDQLCLVLTYNPSHQVPSSPTRTLTTAKRQTSSSFKERTTAKVGRGATVKPQTATGWVKTPTTPMAHAGVDPHKHPKQYYVVALKDISPLAAQMPLSADLRAHLQLNMVDVEAATYSSHSTPRATALSLGSSGSPSTQLSNFYFPPSRAVQPVQSQRTRRASPSVGFVSAAMTATPTYGQYLSAAEPYRVHTRSLHNTPRGPGSSARGAPYHCHPSSNPQGSTSLGEGDFTTMHVSQPPSHASSKSNSPLLTPERETSFGGQVPVSGMNSGFDDRPTPHSLLSPTQKSDALTDLGELLLVAFFGVTTAAGVPNLSFTTDPQGEVLVEKKAKKLAKRTWHKSLFKWFVPTKSEAESVPRRTASLLSTISGVLSSTSTSPQVSPAQPHAPAALPPSTSAKQKAAKFSSAASSKSTTASTPVTAAAAHVDVKKVLELPFTLNQHETFHLRFRTEEDLRDFLAHFVDLQTQLKEAERQRQEASGDASSPLWHPRVRRNRFGEEEFSEGEDGNEYEDGSGGVDTASTASYTDFPRNAAALGGAESNDPLSTGQPRHHSQQTKAPTSAAHSDTHVTGVGGGGEASTSVMPPTAFFRSRGWEDYLRYHLDPRFGVPFASVPLYLWHAFLPLSRTVLYTCYRGFLIVERVPAETQQSDEELCSACGDGGAAASAKDPERVVEEGRQRLNALVNRLLTPIRTAQNPLRHPPRAPPRVNRHGVVEVLPVAPLPLGEDRAVGGGGGVEDAADPSGSASWDAVKLVLPSVGEATGQRNDDHFTTVKDVFLCLSESHLLFLNSFGHLRFQCSLDEVALITQSAATAAFPTYPFFRFRLKSSDYFGAPTFVLTFTLLPEVTHEMRGGGGAAAAAATSSTRSGPLRRGHSAVSSTSSRSTSASSSSAAAARQPSLSVSQNNNNIDSPSRSGVGVSMLGEDEKERLLRRHEDFLRIFAAVCPRPLEKRTFAEMIAGELGRSHRVRFSHLLSAPHAKDSGSPLQPMVPERGTSWMTQSHNDHPILCVTVEADDIELYDTEVAAESNRRTSTVTSTLTQSNATSTGQRDTSVRRRSKNSTSPEVRFRQHPSRGVTPRWGFEDPGIVLQDGGRDMDFSLEVATRTMPLLANKDEVHAGYGSHLASTQHSFHPDVDSHLAEDSNGGAFGEPAAADDFVPMAPKKKRSIILHRTAM